MKKIRGLILAFAGVLIVGSIQSSQVNAGNRTTAMSFLNKTGALNEADWNRSDENVVCEDGKLVVIAENSTADTKFVSKSYAVSDPAIEKMIEVSASLRLTALPEKEKFILAFGLRGVEANEGDDGNIEIIFEDQNGIQVSMARYEAGEKIELLAGKKCGISLNSEFKFDASITSDSLFTVKINGSAIYDQKLPVSGEGRFGIIQTGSCGAVFSSLVNSCSYYDTPENTNIEEDFEDEEFNVNELVSVMSAGNGIGPANLRIEEYNGNKVLMFRNVANGYFGTAKKYSNFELTFDVPYFLRKNVYDSEGKRIADPSAAISVGIGEENTYPQASNSYVYDIDMIDFGPDYVASRLLGAFAVSTRDLGIYDVDSQDDGFSVKITVIDGHCVVQMKNLAGTNWIKLAETDYASFRSGYVCLWVTSNGNFAIDNFKIVNKDVGAKLVDAEYQSSKIVAEDYQLTEEEQTLIFREDVEGTQEDQKTDNSQNLTIVFAAGGCVVLIAIGFVIFLLSKKKKQNGGTI